MFAEDYTVIDHPEEHYSTTSLIHFNEVVRLFRTSKQQAVLEYPLTEDRILIDWGEQDRVKDITVIELAQNNGMQVPHYRQHVEIIYHGDRSVLVSETTDYGYPLWHQVMIKPSAADITALLYAKCAFFHTI